MYQAAATILSFLIPFWMAQSAPNNGIALPDTHAGKCAKAFIDAFNSASPEAMRAFEQTYRAQSALKTRTIDERLKQYGEMRDEWGRIEPVNVTASQERAITLLIHVTRPDANFEFDFVFEETAPYGLHHVTIQGPVSESAGEPLTAQDRSTALEQIAKALDDNYVFPEIGAKMAAMLRDQARAKSYEKFDAPAEFARQVTEDLQAICHDKHLRVRAGQAPDFHGGGPMRRRGTPEDARRENFGFKKVELLPGNIGYIRFDEFNPSDEAKQVARGAMAFVAGCDALIFDLRSNGGGSPEMIRFLSSYLFDKPTHLNSFFDRTNNKTEEFWTTETVPGKRLGEELPVFVLTSKQTFSGAEEFSYNLLNLKRATLVGETTGGGAHPVRPVNVADRFNVMVPYARAVNPITQTNWEGVGVKPHVEVDASQALEKAQDLAAAAIEQRRSSTGSN